MCLCVCLSVNPNANPNPNDVLGIRPYIAKLYDDVYMLMGEACSCTIVNSQ